MPSILDNKPTILSVDDCSVTQCLLEKSLGKNYRVITVDNAIDALKTIYQEPVEILLLDVCMPKIDGLELCRTVRRLPQFKQLPIIMVTSKDSTFDKIQGKMAGATEYLTKPINYQKMLNLIEHYLNQDAVVDQDQEV